MENHESYESHEFRLRKKREGSPLATQQWAELFYAASFGVENGFGTTQGLFFDQNENHQTLGSHLKM